jgi:hypothetical protein
VALVPQQDGSDVLVAACADGAGSAAFAHVGARLACDSTLELVANWIAEGRRVAEIDESTLHEWVETVATKLTVQASAQDVPPRELACTLLFAVLADDASVFAQLGDGAIIRESEQGYTPVFWPQNGPYANTTFFITAAEDRASLQVAVGLPPASELALFTDGLQQLALHHATRSAHQPFFNAFFPRLRAEPPGERAELSWRLAEYLNSAGVTARTDDDTTLILASRLGTATTVSPTPDESVVHGKAATNEPSSDSDISAQ